MVVVRCGLFFLEGDCFSSNVVFLWVWCLCSVFLVRRVFGGEMCEVEKFGVKKKIRKVRSKKNYVRSK